MPVALITGASRGLGRSLATELAKRGWTLVVDARGRGRLDVVAAELTDAGATVTIVPGDIADPTHRDDLIEAVDRYGRLDLLINNASVLGPSPQPALAAYPLDVLRTVLEVNLLAPLALIQDLLPVLRASAGTVVNVSSDAAVEPYEGWGGYGSSKAALDQLSAILGAEEPDIAVYAVDPGDMRTQLHQEAFPGEDISDRPEPETVVPAFLKLLESRPASGRYRASDLLNAVPA